MNFGFAIAALKIGKQLTRKGWNDKGMYLELQRPDEHSKMTLPYIYLNYPSKGVNPNQPDEYSLAKVPWLASQTDMLAEDWEVIE